MDDDDFSPLTIPQLKNHCAPTSLSYCLYLLGFEASQRQLAHAAGVPWRVYRDGLNEIETRRAANAYGVSAKFVMETGKDCGTQFAARLRRHLQQGHPAMLLVWDFGHWIAVLGYADGKFIVADPEDEDRAFAKWTERTLLQNCWNEDEDDDDEQDQYFAILLRRRDHKPTRWNLTDDWLKLVERGSEERLSEMADDVAEVARRAGGTAEATVEFAEVLKAYETLVSEQVQHWVEEDVSLADLRSLYRDFWVTAESLRLRVPRDVDRHSIIAQMATLLCTWVWAGEL